MTIKPIEERAPVLALHCSLGSSAQWRSLARAMPEREVIALDLLGYGEKPFPTKTDDFSLDDEVDAIEQALLGRVDADAPLHVVGHSYGGAVAWRLALRNPGRVKSIALFEPITLWLMQHDAGAQPLHALAVSTGRALETGETMEAARSFIDFWSGEGLFSSLPPERQSALARGMRKVKLDFDACRTERSAVPAPGYLQMPGLLMNGRSGRRVMRTNLQILQPAFEDCVMAEVPGGHMAPIENRLQVDSVIATFIRKCERQTANGDLLSA